jgi:hypothetical protein
VTTTAAAAQRQREPQTPLTYLYVLLVCVVAATLLIAGWVTAGPPRDLVALAVLAVMGILSWLWRESDVGGRVQFSFISIILLASGVIVGPVGAGVVGLLATIAQAGRDAPVVRLFNTAMLSCVGSVGGLVYLLAGGATDVAALSGPAALLLSVGLPLMVADVAQAVTNAALLSGVMRVANGVPVRLQMWKLLTGTGLAYVGYGLIGFLFVVLWIPAGVGWFSAVLVLAPLFVARWAFTQYGDEVRAHERTLNALVAAVDSRDHHTEGHSGRVAQLCEWMGESMGLSHADTQEIRTAGMLHDLGKVAIPASLLGAPHRLDDDELVAVADHPVIGVQMLKDIEFLRGSLEGVAHHHERFDGRGYPDGLAGDDIPLCARLIAVADAFDALTTPRAHRPALPVAEALAEVYRRAGTQFDPQAVAALDRALARHRWVPVEPPLELPPGSADDHDDPEMSDFLAEREDIRRSIRRSCPGGCGLHVHGGTRA